MHLVLSSKILVLAAASTALLWFHPVVSLAGHEGDIALQNANDQIVTGQESPGGFVPHRVFEARFGDEGYANVTETPGFDSEMGTWPVPSSLGIDIFDALRVWDGTDFDAIATERLTMRWTGGSLVTPTSPAVVSGLERGVGSGGDWHKHYEFELGSPRADGIYLLQLGMHSTSPRIAPSTPFWVVFRQDEKADAFGTLAQQEAAVAYAEGHFAPEPGTIAILGSGVALLLLSTARRWRRNRCAWLSR